VRKDTNAADGASISLFGLVPIDCADQNQLEVGGLKIVAKGAILKIRLEKGSGGPMFCESAPIDCTRPIASAIERVLDSSRYFVIKVIDPASKRATHLGIGFREKSDAFDFNAVIQDHVTSSTRQALDSKEEEEEQPEGPSNFSSLVTPVKIELKGLSKPRADGEELAATPALVLLAPPPDSGKKAKPPTNITPIKAPPADEDEWGDFTSST